MFDARKFVELENLTEHLRELRNVARYDAWPRLEATEDNLPALFARVTMLRRGNLGPFFASDAWRTIERLTEDLDPVAAPPQALRRVPEAPPTPPEAA